MAALYAEFGSYLVPLAGALIGYFLRHYHVPVPFLPQSPNPLPAPVSPALPGVLDEILKLLAALRTIQNPAAPAVPVQAAVTVSTAAHDVVVNDAGTTVTAK